MLITVYIYNKSDGLYLYKDIGQAGSVMNDLGHDKDFTTTPPPDQFNQWAWRGNHWQQITPPTDKTDN